MSDEDFDRVYRHTIMAESDDNEDPDGRDSSLYNYDQTIVIAAFPITGIMRPIQRSENYVIYNGCFIRNDWYVYDDIYNMPYLCGNGITQNPKPRKYGNNENDVKMEYLSYRYRMTAYVVMNLFTTFSLFTTDRLSLTEGLITEHRLSGFYDEDVTHDHTFPMYSQLSYTVPVTNENMFTNTQGNLFPINDRPYYALPRMKNKPVKVDFS